MPRARNSRVSPLDDRIEILNRDADEIIPAQTVFRTASTILALVKGKRVDNGDVEELSECCFNACEAVKAAFSRTNAGDLKESTKVAIESIQGVMTKIECTFRRIASTPHSKCSREEIEGYKLEIQRGLDLLNTTTAPLPDINSVFEGSASMAVHRIRGTTSNSPAESAVFRLAEHAFALPERRSLIEAVFSNEDGSKAALALQEESAQSFIDVIDEALLEVSDLSPKIRKKCLRLLYKVCSRNTLIPKALKIVVWYDRADAAKYKGGFADVWKGLHFDREVAVKVLRMYSNTELQKIVGKLCKEVVTWRALRHPNVLPLLGVTMTENQFGIVSDWMGNGNINEFVRANPRTNRLHLLEDVARGLIYIHGQGMIHGDLKGANILIDHHGHALLADFGLLTIISDPTNLLSSSSHTMGGTARWMSPELIDPEKCGVEISRPTRSSDCYALGMVIYETISGKFPFHKHKNPTVFVKVLEGERPPREGCFADSLWEMLRLCWAHDPSSRPTIQEVLECLGRVSQSWEPFYGEVEDADDGTESDTSSDFSVLTIDDDLGRFGILGGTGALANEGGEVFPDDELGGPHALPSISVLRPIPARSPHSSQELPEQSDDIPLVSLNPPPISGYYIPPDLWDNVLVPGTFGASPHRIWDLLRSRSKTLGLSGAPKIRRDEEYV